MEKFFQISFLVITLILVSCSLSSDKNKQQQIIDSLEAESDRNKAIQEAEMFLNENTDSI